MEGQLTLRVRVTTICNRMYLMKEESPKKMLSCGIGCNVGDLLSVDIFGLNSARQCKVKNLNIVLTELEDLIIIGMGKLCKFEIDDHSKGKGWSGLNDRKKHM